jgi:cytoskeletal protein CcmA (bactofilin family)
MPDGLAHLAGSLENLDIREVDWDAFNPAGKYGGKASFAVIDACSEINGRITAKSAFVSGRIDGEVIAETVTIEKTGFVRGTIICKTLIVHGEANARVVCDHLQLSHGSSLVSNLKYNTLNIASGASIIAAFECRTPDLQVARTELLQGEDPWNQEVRRLQSAWRACIGQVHAQIDTLASRAFAFFKTKRK